MGSKLDGEMRRERKSKGKTDRGREHGKQQNKMRNPFARPTQFAINKQADLNQCQAVNFNVFVGIESERVGVFVRNRLKLEK